MNSGSGPAIAARTAGSAATSYSGPSCRRALRNVAAAFWQQLTGSPEGASFWVACDVLEPIAEILRGKGLTVRPFHSLAQVQGENAALLDIDRL